jgi:hypothetical protein
MAKPKRTQALAMVPKLQESSHRDARVDPKSSVLDLRKCPFINCKAGHPTMRKL